jgi:hypothetical protein
MADSYLSHLSDPTSVMPNVLRQALRPRPGLGAQIFLVRMHRATTRPSGRDFNQGLVDEHRHWVEVAGNGLESEALGLERDRATPGERIQDRGRFTIAALEDLSTGLV